MTFDELKTELADRGFDYLSGARLGRFINQACQELDESALWPYRETSVTGSPPVVITDLGVIEMVLDMDTQQPIEPIPYGNLIYEYGDLSITGTPFAYYTATPEGVPQVATYPVGGTIGVQYYKVTPTLSASADEPLAPDRYHPLIVDMAVCRAYRDSDNPSAAEALRASIDRDLMSMFEALLISQIQGPAGYQRITGASVDW